MGVSEKNKGKSNNGIKGNVWGHLGVEGSFTRVNGRGWDGRIGGRGMGRSASKVGL